MKKLAILSLFSLSLFAYDVVIFEQISKKVSPDTLHANLSFKHKSGDQKAIKNSLNSIVDQVKLEDKNSFCSGGGYSIYPEYIYKDGLQKEVGFIGTLGFDCGFDSIDSYNDLTGKIDKSLPKGATRNENPLSYKISKNLYQQTKKELDFELISKAKEVAKELSSEMKSKCRLLSVEIQKSQTSHLVMAKSSTFSSDTSAPISTEVEVESEAKITLDCK